MNAEFFTALELLEKEKGIPADYMIEKIEAALISAYKKEYGTGNVRVLIDPVKKDVRVYQQKEVVEEVENPELQISLADARAIAKKYTLGSVVETEVKTKNFRRLSAAAAKSVIIQGIREGERRVMQEGRNMKERRDRKGRWAAQERRGRGSARAGRGGARAGRSLWGCGGRRRA